MIQTQKTKQQKKRETYVVNSVIRNPVKSVNRDTINVPRGFKLVSIYANVKEGLIDVKDNNKSIFGRNPLPCFVFDTLTKRFDFPIPVEITTSLDIEVDLTEASSPPSTIVISFIGFVEKEEQQIQTQTQTT